jgi:hypothetical protein
LEEYSRVEEDLSKLKIEKSPVSIKAGRRKKLIYFIVALTILPG